MMKNNLLRLVSVAENGVMESGNGFMDIIYSYLLQQFELKFYNHIHITQIGEDLDELIIKEGTQIHVNIRYKTPSDFNQRDDKYKNLVRLEIIHEALMKIAENDNKLNVEKLEEIRNTIVKNDFYFQFIYKQYRNKFKPGLIATIIIQPEVQQFNFFVEIEGTEMEKCRLLIYQGKTTDYYIDGLFGYGKWSGQNEFIISGKRKIVEIHVRVVECKVEYVNISGYKDKAPFFEMMKAGKSDKEKNEDYQDWIHSLPPAVTAIITHAPN